MKWLLLFILPHPVQLGGDTVQVRSEHHSHRQCEQAAKESRHYIENMSVTGRGMGIIVRCVKARRSHGDDNG